MRKNWTTSEDDILKANYKLLGISMTSFLLNRSEKSVALRAQRLGLSDKASPHWTEEEINVLRSSHDVSLQELSDKLGRTKEGIRRKTRKLGIYHRFVSKRFPSTSSATIDPLLAAYIAGLFDGEGHIRIDVIKGISRWRFSSKMEIKIAAYDAEALDFCCLTSGIGTCRVEKGNKIPMVRWSIGGTWSIYLAKAILPYSHIKRKRLEYFIRFYESRLSHKPNLLTLEELQCVIEISRINAKRAGTFTKVKMLEEYVRANFPPGVTELNIPTHHR